MKVYVQLCIISISLGLAASPLADTVYFKNGFRTEAEVKRTKEGVWVNGGLFGEDEIEKIEPSTRAGTEQPVKKKTWYENLLGNKAESPAAPAKGPKAARKEAAPKKQDGLLQQLIEANTPAGFALQDQMVEDTTNAYGNRMSTMADVLSEANRLQQEAYQQQLMMQQEIMRAEMGIESGGLPGDYTMPTTAEQQKLYDEQYRQIEAMQDPYLDSNTSSSTNKKRRSSSYQKKKDPRNKNFGDRSRLGNKIRIGPYGETSWE